MSREKTDTEAAIEDIEFRMPLCIVNVTSDIFSQTDPVLGRRLARSFILAVASSSMVPEKMIFMGSGLWLLQDEDIMSALEELQNREVEILCCSESADEMMISADSLTGRLASMEEITSELLNAGNVITI